MANVFNSMSKRVIFHKLHATNGNIIRLIPFVCAFYAFESHMFYNHHNHEGSVTVIPSTMGICQGDIGGGGVAIHFNPF